ncbi:MAG: hypothetical protein M3P26_10515 [Gemmatimonadota bacterium]|nr:hypothetical protein [Gemmatimonadota bacterium]
MPVVNGRLTCCVCGADLGDAEDPYRDPDCINCATNEAQAEAEEERTHNLWNDAPTERELMKDFDTEEDRPDCADDDGPYDADEAREVYYGDLGILP